LQVSQTLQTLKHQNLSLSSSHLIRSSQNPNQALNEDPENQSSLMTQLKNSLSSKKSELIELEFKIEELAGKLKVEKNKKENQSKIRKMNTSELFIENSRLKDVIREAESEQVLFSLQVMQALEVLKLQIERERKEKTELEKGRENVVGLKAGEGLVEGYKETVKGLQEEVSIVRLNLQKLKKVGSGFETLNQEEDPAGPNCKCIIY
jgi:hypothetical protein